ncbi:hypothetical protein [Endozoicomonas numazuensis]|uniref:hypothetical protein n=1 Tax=Endozoicomonas numazuensis TaxID=1137799 RepID=UPI000689BB60|nr:hypothetical protein [Endozoicomonas numazuensis]
MKYLVFFLLTGLVASFVNAQSTEETLVIFRHGEKPKAGLGQLDCRGLNRSLLLPDLLLEKYPKPDFLFAPKPSDRVYERHGDQKHYDYVRPLATIEPTAIRLGLPVNVQFGYKQVRALASEVTKTKYHHATLYLVWEHSEILRFVKELQKQFGNYQLTEDWGNEEYNRVLIIKMNWDQKPPEMELKEQELSIHNLSDRCPGIDRTSKIVE